MNTGPTICNSSPLIALNQIGELDLLQKLFVEIIVPPAVVLEVPPTATAQTWIRQRACGQSLAPSLLAPMLGPGECEAISLAVELFAARIILDDRPARRTAQALGLNVIGTLGLLLAGKRHGYISSLRRCLEALELVHFHVSPALVRQVLKDAGE